VLDEMIAATQPGGLVAPDDPNALGLAWNSVALATLRSGAPYLAIATYNRGIEHLLRLQRLQDRRFHKGMFRCNVALGHVAADERDAALWFHRLAFIEDALSRNAGDTARPETPATAMLRLYHGVPNSTIDAWLSHVGHAALLDAKNPTQRLKARYPEVSVVDAALDGSLGPSRPDARSHILVNALLLEDLDATLDTSDTNISGVNLERLTTYLCLTLPGARLTNRVRTKIGELDLVVVLREAAPSYFLEFLGHTLLVECKNWDSVVGVQEINHLAARVRLHGCRTGLLVATKGVSGTRAPGKELTFGQLLIQGWFHQDGVMICVVDRSDIRSLGSKHLTFADMVLEKCDTVRFAYSALGGP
jgi:hypothetical protein